MSELERFTKEHPDIAHRVVAEVRHRQSENFRRWHTAAYFGSFEAERTFGPLEPSRLLRRFREHAPANGVDAKAVLSELAETDPEPYEQYRSRRAGIAWSDWTHGAGKD